MADHNHMKRVRDILAIANDAPEGSPEREVALKRAEALMAKYAIDQAMLDASRSEGERRKPTVLEFVLIDGPGHEWGSHFRLVFDLLCRANGCRSVTHGNFTKAKVVGFAEDAEWVQLLWMQIFMEFVSKIHPTWESNRSRPANIRAFKEAGYKWSQIWEMVRRAEGTTPDGFDSYRNPGCGWLITEYKSECKRVGKEPMATQRFDAYRASFVESFTGAVMARLERMAEDRRQAADSVPGSALAVVDAQDRVDEEFYRMYPNRRPLTEEEIRRQREEEDRQKREDAEKDAAWLASLTPERRERELRRRAEEMERRARADDRAWRRWLKEADKYRGDVAGYAAGREAGDNVSLDRKSAVPHHNRPEVEG